MAQLPASEKMRPSLALLVKHHFWLLAAVVPLMLVPLLFIARGRFESQITAVRNQIKGYIQSLETIRKITQHPNDAWSSDIDTSTMRVKRETFAEWRRFWEDQKPFRTWPESLGPDFVKAAEALKPDGNLSRKLLERYHNNVRTLVRELPERMGVEESMVDANPGGQTRPLAPQPVPQPDFMPPGSMPSDGQFQASPYFFTWNQANQRLIYSSFDWEKAPTTTRVVLAQEELRVYGLFCDSISRVNKSGSGPHNVPILSVDELLVGYPAAEDNPGGSLGGRITRPATVSTGGPDGMMGGMMGGPMGGQMGGMPTDTMASEQPGGAALPAMRPPNPQFMGNAAGGQPAGMAGMGGMGGGPPGEGEGAAAVVSPDDMLRNWAYVDFTGRPLDATQLAAAADAQMVHLVPFVMRLVIDQRQIDNLLVDLAMTPLPVDVRQVRINASASGPASGAMMSPAPSGPASAIGRLYDVTLELRGTIGLATPPNEKAVGLTPEQANEAVSEDAGEKPAAAPAKAALLGRPSRRRTSS